MINVDLIELQSDRQKLIEIHATHGKDFDCLVIEKALSDLTPLGFALYLYLYDKNSVWALNNRDVLRKLGFTPEECAEAKAELFDKGYLTAGKIDAIKIHPSVRVYKQKTYHFWSNPELRKESC